MKKLALIVAVILVISTLFTVMAAARGHHGSRTTRTTYALCGVEDCDLSGNHYHGRTCYSGHYIGDGHDWHEVCDVAGCRQTRVHEHDGEYCFPRSSGSAGRGSGYGGGCCR